MKKLQLFMNDVSKWFPESLLQQSWHFLPLPSVKTFSWQRCSFLWILLHIFHFELNILATKLTLKSPISRHFEKYFLNACDFVVGKLHYFLAPYPGTWLLICTQPVVSWCIKENTKDKDKRSIWEELDLSSVSSKWECELDPQIT